MSTQNHLFIDAREAFCKQPTGKGVFNRSLVATLLELKLKRKVTLLLDNQSILDIALPKNWQIKKFDGLGLGWQLKASKWLNKQAKGHLISPTSYLLPLLTKMKSTVVVHDLISFLYSKNHHWKAKLIEKYCLPRLAKRTNVGFVCVSQSTADDLLRCLPNLKVERVKIAKPGLPIVFAKACLKQSLKAKSLNLQERGGISEAPFVLAVATLIPRKNIKRLILAFDKLLQENKNLQKHRLIVIGGSGWGQRELERVLKSLNFKSQIDLRGYATTAELVGLYKQAELFVFPSLYEGFGLPLLEAMLTRCPILCSDISVFHEVAGTAASYFDPYNEEDLKNKLKFLLTNHELQQILVGNGAKQLKNFDWQKTAQVFVDSSLSK